MVGSSTLQRKSTLKSFPELTASSTSFKKVPLLLLLLHTTTNSQTQPHPQRRRTTTITITTTTITITTTTIIIITAAAVIIIITTTTTTECYCCYCAVEEDVCGGLSEGKGTRTAKEVCLQISCSHDQSPAFSREISYSFR